MKTNRQVAAQRVGLANRTHGLTGTPEYKAVLSARNVGPLFIRTEEAS